MKDYNWKSIKTEYVTTDISYRKLAEKYGVSYSQVVWHGGAEKWVEARRDYQSKTIAKTIEKASEIESGRLAKLMTATTKVVDVALEALEDADQFNRYVITEGLGGGATETTERIFAKKDTKALSDIMKVIKECTSLMRDFYNIPTPAQAESRRIAAARLEIEQQKAEAGTTDNVITVVIPPELDKFCQ